MAKPTAPTAFQPAHLATRFRLLEAAARHIADRGFEGASLRDIADDVQLTTGAIYRHFPGGKQELYTEILAFVADGIRRSLEHELRQPLAPLEAIIAGCAAGWDFFAAHPAFAALIVREGISGGPSSPYFGTNETTMQLFKSALDAAASAGVIRPISPSHFVFSVGAYCLSFHGAKSMRRAIFAERELGDARAQFLSHVRFLLTP